MDDALQQEKEFFSELVNRFFNENSYFFHCVNHELDGVLTETKDGDNEIYLMLGNFFDKLISTDDIIGELENLKQVNEFFEFVDKLEQSVSFLKNNELDTERMKIEIEGLAHSMFNSALLAFQSPNTVEYFKSYLNGDNPYPGEIKEKADDKLAPEEVVTEELAQEKFISEEIITEEFVSENPISEEVITEEFTQESSIAEDVIAEDFTLESSISEEVITEEFIQERLITENIITEEFTSEEIEAKKNIHEEFRPEQRVDEEFVKNEREIEELSSTEPVDVESALTDKTESLKESQGNEDEKDFHLQANFDKDVRLTGGLNNSKSIEDSSSISLDETTISPQPDSFPSAFLSEMKEKTAALQKLAAQKTITQRNWKKSIEITDSIMMSSVIYGFEAFEQISGKAKKQLKKYIAAAEYDRAKSLLTSTIDNLTSLLESNDPENVSPSFVKSATQKMTSSRETQTEPPLPKALVEETPQEEKKNLAKTVTEVYEPPSHLSQEVTKIKIPGEDDEEIHNLIAEISREKAIKNPSTEEYPIKIESRFETEDVIHIDVSEVVDDETLSTYKQQAELYFNVIEDALITLERQRRNKTALEDLELASNSLYGLSLKLNLDPIGKFPDLILTLIKNILATDYTITEKDHALIKRGFNDFKNLENFEDLNGSKFDEIIEAITLFNDQVKKQASHNVESVSYSSSGRIGFA